jgi:hypothetical protein
MRLLDSSGTPLRRTVGFASEVVQDDDLGGGCGFTIGPYEEAYDGPPVDEAVYATRPQKEVT